MNLDSIKQILLSLAATFGIFQDGPPIDMVKLKVITPTPLLINETHQTYHYPVINGKTINPTPYLFLPLSKTESPKYDITEGWIYSQQELSIHHRDPIHQGVDIHVPYGTNIYSPVEGYAYSTYMSFTPLDDFGEPIYYQGKPIRFGLGYHIHIYVPEVNRFVLLGHLSDIDSKIPFLPPTLNGDKWKPTGWDITIDEMETSPYVTKVKKGDLLGRVGTSGLGWDYDEYIEGYKRPVYLEPNLYKSWDEPHIHLEDFWFDQQTLEKGWERDPYGIYNTNEYYPTPNRKTVIGKDPLWLLDENNLPQFAK